MDFELTAEQRMLQEQVARFVDQEVIPRAAVIDEEERFPEENFRAMAAMGLFGITLPETYGGAGADFLSSVLVMEELMRGCVSTGNTYGATPSSARKASSGTGRRGSGRDCCRTSSPGKRSGPWP